MKKKVADQLLEYKTQSPKWTIRIGSFGQPGQIGSTFEEIEKKTGKKESDVIKIMRRSLKPSSFRLWRKRVNQKSIKHRKKFEYSRKEIASKIKKGDYL